MKAFEEKEYKVFDMFINNWALVTAGGMDDYNTMTIGWGSLGTIWTGSPKDKRSIVTVYVHPDRYTSEFLKKYDTFTVSFYPQQYKKALGYLGSHSGRDGDKVKASGLTPVAMGDGVTFQEAELTFLCRKLYFHQFAKEGLADEIKEYYAGNPKMYPHVTDDGTQDTWEPHYVIIGQILDADDKR